MKTLIVTALFLLTLPAAHALECAEPTSQTALLEQQIATARAEHSAAMKISEDTSLSKRQRGAAYGRALVLSSELLRIRNEMVDLQIAYSQCVREKNAEILRQAHALPGYAEIKDTEVEGE
jgi:hypothetical protein